MLKYKIRFHSVQLGLLLFYRMIDSPHAIPPFSQCDVISYAAVLVFNDFIYLCFRGLLEDMIKFFISLPFWWWVAIYLHITPSSFWFPAHFFFKQEHQAHVMLLLQF